MPTVADMRNEGLCQSHGPPASPANGRPRAGDLLEVVIEYPYVRITVFGVSRADVRTESPLTEGDIRSAYEEQPAHIRAEAGCVTVAFDDAGPTCTYYSERLADWGAEV